MKTKTLRKMSVVAIAGLMVFGMSGCSKDKEKEADIETINSESIENLKELVAAESNVVSEKDAKEISELLNSINDDAFEIMKDGVYSDEEYSSFAEKYAIDKSNQQEIKNFIGFLSYVTDGYDGEYNDKYQKWNSINILNRMSYYSLFPLKDVKVFFGDGYESYFSKTKDNLSNIKIENEKTDTRTFAYIGSHESWKQSKGLINSSWLTDILPLLKEQDENMEIIPSYNLTFKYIYDKDYPKNDIELTNENRIDSNDELLKIIKKPANTLDVILVKTDNGWKLLGSKWLYSTTNVDNNME